MANNGHVVNGSSGVCLEQRSQLLVALEGLLMSSQDSDVTFLIEDHVFKAHRLVLSMQSPVFRKVLFGEGKADGSDTIVLGEKSPAAFRLLLKYLYTGIVGTTDARTQLELLRMAHKYQINNLYKGLTKYVLSHLETDNVLEALEMALLLKNKNLLNSCNQLITEKAADVLRHSKFLNLSKNAVYHLLTLDKLKAPEKDVALAVSMWHQRNPEHRLTEIFERKSFHSVALPAIPESKFGALNNLLTAAQEFETRKGLGHPVSSVTERADVYSFSGGVERPENLLRPAARLKGAHFYQNDFVIVELDNVYMVQSIAFFIYPSCTGFSHDYAVEVSTDAECWKTIANAEFKTKSYKVNRQLLIFPEQPVKYLKLRAGNRRFHGSGLECPANGITEANIASYHVKCKKRETLVISEDKETVVV